MTKAVQKDDKKKKGPMKAMKKAAKKRDSNWTWRGRTAEERALYEEAHLKVVSAAEMVSDAKELLDSALMML